MTPTFNNLYQYQYVVDNFHNMGYKNFNDEDLNSWQEYRKSLDPHEFDIERIYG